MKYIYNIQNKNGLLSYHFCKTMNESFTIIYKEERFNVDPTKLQVTSNKFKELISNKEDIEKYSLRILNNIFSTQSISDFLQLCEDKEVNFEKVDFKEICLIAQMFQANQIFNKMIKHIHKNIDNNYSIPTSQIEELKKNEYLVLELKMTDFEYDEIQTKTDIKDNNKKKSRSICYQIKTDSPNMKCQRIYLMKENQIIFMAKQKNNDIFIGEGDEFHLSEQKINKPVKIKRNCKGYNVVNTNDQEFLIKYLKYGEKTKVCLSFHHDGEENHWNPKHSKSKESIKGEYNHKPLKSKKNMVLQNERNHSTFILRKIAKKTYEIECHRAVNPVIAFSIAISQIIGPIGL